MLEAKFQGEQVAYLKLKHRQPNEPQRKWRSTMQFDHPASIKPKKTKEKTNHPPISDGVGIS